MVGAPKNTIGSRVRALAIFALLALTVTGCGRQRGGISSVRIGSQVWMADNLDAGRYRNGDEVREARSVAEWNDAISKEEGAWCRAGDDPRNGRLYNWFAVADPRGLAPEGWHIPSDAEWRELESATGGRGLETTYPGSRNCLGNFFGAGSMAFFWTSTPAGGFNAWNRELISGGAALQRVSVGRGLGLSVRCVKDR